MQELNSEVKIRCELRIYDSVVFIDHVRDRRAIMVNIRLDSEPFVGYGQNNLYAICKKNPLFTVLIWNDIVSYNCHVIDHISGFDRANADTVSSSAIVVGEDDIPSRIDRNTVVLIDDCATAVQ